MKDFSADGVSTLQDVARRHGVSYEAALALWQALARGNGTQAQFSHPDLGGMGQWSRGGMIMIGDMFNQQLKARVAALCDELAGLLTRRPSLLEDAPSVSNDPGEQVSRSSGKQGSWWPADLGTPSSTGAQNDMRYAWFSGARRIAIEHAGKLQVYDTVDHRISGFAQQQGSDQSLTFTSQTGVVRLAELEDVTPASRE